MSKRTGKNANIAILEWDSGSDPEHDEEKRHKVLILLPLPYPYLTYHWETRRSCKHTYYAFTCQSHSVMILLKFPSTEKLVYSEFQVTIENNFVIT